MSGNDITSALERKSSTKICLKYAVELSNFLKYALRVQNKGLSVINDFEIGSKPPWLVFLDYRGILVQGSPDFWPRGIRLLAFLQAIVSNTLTLIHKGLR